MQYPDCTLVTSCFCLSEFNPHSRNLDDSTQSMAPLLEVECYLVIFTDSICLSRIKELRESFNHLTHYIVSDFNKLTYYYLNDTIKSNRLKYHPSRDDRTCSESHLLCCSKFDFVQQTINLNPFHTSKFGWIDSNIRPQFSKICENYNKEIFLTILNRVSEKFHIEILNVCDKKYKSLENKKEYYSKYQWVVAGSFFTCGKKIGTSVLTRLNDVFVETTMNGFGHGEEMLYLEVLDEYFDDIERSYGDYGQTLNNWIHPTCNLRYIYYCIIKRYLDFGYNKECYHCCKQLLHSIETLHVKCGPDVYFLTLFAYYVSSFYYDQSNTLPILTHTMDLINATPALKVEFEKRQEFYVSQFSYGLKLRPTYRLVIHVFACATIEKYKHEILKINETWGKLAEQQGVKVLFFLGEEQTDLVDPEKYVYLKGIRNDYESASYKQNLGLKYVYDHYNADFVLCCGSDTYVNIKNLLLTLNKYNKNENLYIGGHGDIRKIGKKHIYFHSGAGFILSHAALKMVHPLLHNMFDEWANVCKLNDVTNLLPACDVCIAYYINMFNSTVVETNPNIYCCNHQGLMHNGTYTCCGTKVNLPSIILCHSMTMRDFDEYTTLLDI